ncbi:MAG: rhomboid family intramembrane serine protease [archaeon]
MRDKDWKGKIPIITILLSLTLIIIFIGSITYIPDYPNNNVVNEKITVNHDTDFSETPYKLLTGMFFHKNFTHLILNVSFLLLIGSCIELLISRLKYLFMIFGTGIISILFLTYFSHSAFSAMGSSIFLMGLAGVYLAIKKFDIDLIFYPPSNLKIVKYAELPIITISLIMFPVIDFSLVANNSLPTFSFYSHFVSLIFGFLITSLVKTVDKNFAQPLKIIEEDKGRIKIKVVKSFEIGNKKFDKGEILKIPVKLYEEYENNIKKVDDIKEDTLIDELNYIVNNQLNNTKKEKEVEELEKVVSLLNDSKKVEEDYTEQLQEIVDLLEN